MKGSETIRSNVDLVRSRIDAALARAGRDPGSCRLLAVTKNRSPAEIEALARAGQSDFGENRVQEAAAKIPDVRAAGSWHLIGHLQRNKVKKALELFDVVHSVDSVRLIEAVGRQADARREEIDVLFEVNVVGSETKFGFRPEEVEDACRRARDLPRLRLRGLMTMAPFLTGDDDPEAVRPVFRRLRELRDRLNDSGVPPEPMAELSMGMSQDYEVAVEEGATWARVGTALFESRG